jgi:lysophospholipase L1-like esterase
MVGRPAIMVRILDEELQARRGVAPLVIVGVGYNSLWERGRRNYSRWAAEFDRRAKSLLATLKVRGAEQFVWVTLRQARRGVIPASAFWQFDRYAWYFPYVNQRLRRLDGLRGDLTLARWGAVANRPGITYDAIHLNPKGAALMARTIKEAIRAAARAQRIATSRSAAPAAGRCAARAGSRARGTRASRRP